MTSEHRPGDVRKGMESVDGFFSSNYLFASRYSRGSVLDVGCGTGYGTRYLARSAEEAIGVDYDPKTINACNSHPTTRARFICANAASLDFPDNCFDLITAFEVIEHLNDREVRAFLSQSRRCLKPDGLLVLSTPNKKVSSPGLARPILLAHQIEYTDAQLTQLLSCFFQDVQVTGKDCSNPEFTKHRVRQEAGLRRRSAVLASQCPASRTIARLLPVGVRNKLTGNQIVPTTPEEWVFDSSFSDSWSLVAICAKRYT